VRVKLLEERSKKWIDTIYSWLLGWQHFYLFV
jgi:hypothetical protein